MRKGLAIATAIGIGLVSARADAVVIDFNELANDSYFVDAGNPYVAQGYQFSNSGSTPAYIVWGRSGFGPTYNADAAPLTGATLAHNQNQSTTIVSRLDGQLFTLNKLDIADVYNTGAPLGPVVFSFTTLLGTTSETRFFDAIRGLQTEQFNLTGLVSFSITPQQYQPPNSFAVAGFIQFDNVDVVGAATPGAVPEPASWALMLMGFGSMGYVTRRSRKIAIGLS